MMFMNCVTLQTVDYLPNTVVNLYKAFQSCSNLTAITTNFPDSVVDMADCFLQCANLTTIPVLPNNVVYLNDTFRNCTALTAFNGDIPDSVIYMQNCFTNCVNLQTFPNLSNNVTQLANTFINCRSMMTAPNIPASVTNLYTTFQYCVNLTGNIYIHSSEVASCSFCFRYTNNSLTKNVYIPFTYPNGVNTKTYNVFSASYGSGQNGVTLFDINQL